MFYSVQASARWEEGATWLARAGAPCTPSSASRTTPLHLAANHGIMSLVEALLVTACSSETLAGGDQQPQSSNHSADASAGAGAGAGAGAVETDVATADPLPSARALAQVRLAGHVVACAAGGIVDELLDAISVAASKIAAHVLSHGRHSTRYETQASHAVCISVCVCVRVCACVCRSRFDVMR